MLRVCHLSPAYFARESVLGGGERFAEELARAMARRARVKFVSFGRRAGRESMAGGEAPYERVILRSWTRDPATPFSPRLFAELRGADVIHCHQYYVLPTVLACLQGHLQGSRVFVSDLGGGGWTPGYQIDQSRWIAAHLPISLYAARSLPGRNRSRHVIYGGVDLERYPMRPAPAHDGSLVFLGRLLPHKGVHFLIEGLPDGVPLHLLGTAPDPDYLERLRRLAGAKPVEFHLGLADDEVLGYLQRAAALVHPTPVSADGSAGVHELFGLALVEAMACGCPVVASAAASLPEIVTDGVTGYLVEPNSPAALGAAVRRLLADLPTWRRLSDAARQRVVADFTWDRVVDRCFAAYSESPRTEAA